MAKLELREEPGGLRHYLDSLPVHAGDMLEIQMPDGPWETTRYEYAGTPAARAALYVRMGAGQGLWMDVLPTHELRWPQLASTAPPRGERMTCPMRRADGSRCGAPVTALHERHGLVCEEHYRAP